MIYCINNRCPVRWDSLRIKAAPKPGKGRTYWKHMGCAPPPGHGQAGVHSCQHPIRDHRRAEFIGDSCNMEGGNYGDRTCERMA